MVVRRNAFSQHDTAYSTGAAGLDRRLMTQRPAFHEIINHHLQGENAASAQALVKIESVECMAALMRQVAMVLRAVRPTCTSPDSPVDPSRR
jgi:hypothetical protein